MALVLADRTKETTTTTGTGSYTLSGAVTGYAGFGDSLADGDTTYYAVSTALGAEWEVGLGTYSTTGPSVARTTVLASSNSGAAVNFSAGTKDIYIVHPADKKVYLDASGHLDVPNNLTVGGDLVVTGTTTSINVEQLDVSDNLIHIAHDNTGDVTDFGWVGHFNDGSDNHAGIFRDASDGKFYIFDNFTASELTGATVDRGDPSFSLATLVGGTFEGAVIGNVTGNVTGALTGNADTATTLATSRTISLSGDVAGSVSFNGSTNVDITTTVQPNSVALGTDTTGNYVSDVVAGFGINVSHTPGEGSSATITHTDTSTQSSVNNSGNTFIQDITLDTYGHITGLASATAVINDGTLTMNTSGVGLSGSATFTANDSDNVTYTVTSNATANNTASTIVARDASGNFTAGTITAALSGSATSLATGRTISLTGDVTGTSGAFDGTGNVSITATVADDSHNHVISNVDGLQTALDAKLASSSYTASDVLTKIKTVDGSGSGLDADTVDGLQASSFVRSDASTAISGDNHITFGPNSSWASSLRIGGNGRTATGTEMASIVTTDGNIHMDAANSVNAIYLNYYAGTNGIRFGNGNNGQIGQVDSSGNLTMNGDVTAYSDERLKDNVEVIKDAVKKVKAIRGVTYNRNDMDGAPKQCGVIAQEVERVLPEVVRVDDDERATKTVAYGNMVGLLIEAIKELSAEIEELKAK